MQITHNLRKVIALQPKAAKAHDRFGGYDGGMAKSRDTHPVSFMRDNYEIKKRRKRTESITFRLESAILDTLREEAKRKDVSVNTLVSQIARQHTSWHSIAAQAGFISVRKSLIAKLIENKNDEEIKNLARYVNRTSNKDFILVLRKRYNIGNALDIIESWMRTSGYFYTHNVEDLDTAKMHTFIVQHDMGKKWSLYLSELYRNIFEGFGVTNAQLDITESMLAFDVTIPEDDDDGGFEGNQGQRRVLLDYLNRS